MLSSLQGDKHSLSHPSLQLKTSSTFTFSAIIMESLAIIILLVASTCICCGSAGNFQTVIDAIEEKSALLVDHEFFKYLSNDSVPAKKRMQFMPYWTYFSMVGSDLLDSWFRIPNPQTELERRVNVFIDEDNFHYNLFLHDVENELGYTTSDFGSYTAVLRHLWGDDSKAVRMLVYTWGTGAKKNNDPLLTLASFEAVEAGLKYLFESIYENISKREDGYPGLQYFGQMHIDFEKSHTVTGWFKEGDDDFRSLGSYDASEETLRFSMEVVDDLFYWFNKVYDSLYNLCLAEDSIHPEKYIVSDYPPMNAFPAQHPNRVLQFDTPKDEL